jgi:hypothetical protein
MAFQLSTDMKTDTDHNGQAQIDVGVAPLRFGETSQPPIGPIGHPARRHDNSIEPHWGSPVTERTKKRSTMQFFSHSHHLRLPKKKTTLQSDSTQMSVYHAGMKARGGPGYPPLVCVD